jgi:hypothetical protein
MLLSGEGPFDLIGKTIEGIDEISLGSVYETSVLVSYKNMAFLLKGYDTQGGSFTRDTVTPSGSVFTADERKLLHEQGLDSIKPQ